MIFLDKPPNIVVQRGYDADEPVFLEQVSEYLQQKGERLYLMQRLDRGTSGVMFFSKRSEINRNLPRQFEAKSIQKIYIALVEGLVMQRQLIDAPLARIGPISFGVRPGGKRAITWIEPMNREGSSGGTLLRIGLRTGRTHQIRAHLAAIGHPLVGDWLYGERNAARPMLHAQSLEMRHPKTGERFRVEAPIPADLLAEAERRVKSERGPKWKAST